MKLIIPKNYTEFLNWVKERTEYLWSIKSEENSDNWTFGAKWIGMTDKEIELIENKHSIKFTEHHKEFLKILHTIDRKQTFSNHNSTTDEESLFYNWNTDDKKILKYLKQPSELLLEGVLKGTIWLDSWGKKPESKKNQEEIFLNWYNNAPKLVPIYGHRFLISEPLTSDNPVLSIHGNDTIIYGSNMRHYLINELQEELGSIQEIYDKEEHEWSIEPIKELDDVQKYEFNSLKEKSIPAWKEFLKSNGFNDYLNKDNKELW